MMEDLGPSSKTTLNYGDVIINFIKVIIEDPQTNQATFKPIKTKKIQVKFSDLEANNIYYITEVIGIPFYSAYNDLLYEAISRCAMSMPRGSEEIFVCLVTWNDLDHSDFMMEFNVVRGVHVEEDKAISWDVVEVKTNETLNEVLRVCKPPIPCLRKGKVAVGSSLENCCCSICLQDFPVGSEIASTTCSHSYHGCCIVQWLAKNNVCPLCRRRLLVG